MNTLMRPPLMLTVNGKSLTVSAEPGTRLSSLLRDDLHLYATKIGCDAGDCGACTVLMDGAPVCACLTAAAQADGADIRTLEGLSAQPETHALQDAFLRHGAAQCGICTPGMIVSATALLMRENTISAAQVENALGGVLCRCTGYRKIINAVLDAASALRGEINPEDAMPAAGAAVGARIPRLDGREKITGQDIFGADAHPDDALLARAVRAPYHRASFVFGDLAAYAAGNPGIVRIFTAADIPGRNCHGVIPPLADQPVFAQKETRFKGEAVALVVGGRAAIESLDLAQFPVSFTELHAVLSVNAATADNAPLLHDSRANNILVRGRVVRGDVDKALTEGISVAGRFDTGFVEHAPIEPEAGMAWRDGDRIIVQACTQAPYMDRDDLALILGVPNEAVRIIPTSTGGGFGTKLDLSVQPFIALAAWHLNRPVRMVYSRPESIMTTTKRHAAHMDVRVSATADGLLQGIDFSGDFNTGAYASWGPTVANRVPVHASGPYFVPHYRALTRAVHTHVTPAGAFRGFGVPQASIAVEQLYDELADALKIDPLDFRLRNALRGDQPTVTGQILGEGVGIRACFEALQPHWQRANRDADRFNRTAPAHLRRGAGIAGMWYGCGNTSLSNPSTIRAGITGDGRIILHQAAVDIGQGSNTVIPQIFADALGVPVSSIMTVGADTDLSPDCGKTSASRQTFVTGKAAYLAGRALREKLLRLTNAGEQASLRVEHGAITAEAGQARLRADLSQLPLDQFGYAIRVQETFDPPTKPLDKDGQGDPYALYGFGAHLAEIEADVELGTVRVLKITAAHDVGRAINPTLVEGQIEGGVAQGLGLALMEEFIPGRGENLHDYLIPTVGDVPPVESLLIEDASPIGPYGAKGIGEQALIPTAPAILNAIARATGVRMRRTPVTPDRLRAALLKRQPS